MKEYALFLGCTIPARQPNYELSARKSLSKLGIKLLDLPNTTCCAPPPIRSISMEAGLAIAAYNISLAEEKDLDIITLCSGCFESLSVTNRLLKENDELKERVNETLAQAEKEFRGTREVKHYLQVLVNEVGIKALKSKVIKPMNGLKVAAFYGCHILRPSELLNFDDPEKPRILDDLIKALGADSIEYRDKLKCCGGLLRGYSDELALQLAREKLKNASE
ncbi:TPA: hypothetical protein EYP70_02970, partial [Candidatus Bathyarchaeota archaeon]|nr:hypothetical protein [Candidatus Bathyarchaeota archaeon]